MTATIGRIYESPNSGFRFRVVRIDTGYIEAQPVGLDGKAFKEDPVTFFRSYFETSFKSV